MVAWFAGVFFLGRLLIYSKEARDAENKQEVLVLCDVGMKRVWTIIILPAMIITVSVGVALAYLTSAFDQEWFHLKLMLVIFFIGYCNYLNFLRQNTRFTNVLPSAKALRLLNELPFAFLIAIVFVVYMKSFTALLYAAGLLIALVFAVLLVKSIKAYLK